MGNFDVENEIKQASENLNKETIKQMDKCLQELTTSGLPSLDAAVMKKFKRFCRESDDYVRYAFLLVMRQLKKQHSEIRLSAFQIADELFNRSHAFREILVIHLQNFLALTTETELKRPLPPPKAAASKLKTDVLHALQQWYDKYGQGYKKLVIGYEYLKNCRHVDFNDIRVQNLAERQRLENEKKRKEKIMADKLTKVLKDIAEMKPEIEICAKEAESCLQLLLPAPTDFLLSLSEEAGSGEGRVVSERVEEKRISCSSKIDKSEKVQIIKDNEACSFKSSFSCLYHGHDSFTKAKPHCTKENEEVVAVAHDNSQILSIKDTTLVGEVKESNSTETTSTVASGDDVERDNDISDIEYDISDEDVDNDDGAYNGDLQVHGLTHPTQGITLDIPAPGPVSVQVTTDNKDVVCTLQDASKLISSNYLPKVIKWLEILGKNGAKQSDITSAIDLKVHLQNIKLKCVDLNLVPEGMEKVDDSDSDDDDLEEVPEKEGYEPHVPDHLRDLYGLAGPSAAAKALIVPSKTKNRAHTSSCDNVGSKTVATAKQGNLKKWNETNSAADPTTLAAALARVKSESSYSHPVASTSSTSVSQEATSVPFVEFGADLAFWENPEKMEAPTIVKFDSLHRFWAPKELEAEKPSQHDLAAVRNRSFTYVGTFEPVKWKCRAPMLNGKLCQRMDRIKCPFHGKIIPRDEQGNPSQTEQPSTSGQALVKTHVELGVEQKGVAEDSELPPWQDPELQREIEQATGHDLGSTRSQKLLDKKARKKGKGKSGKKSNLTDINALKNTARKRLQDRVFNKGSLKRVCATLDRTDYKRVRDKFGNQFNYSLH